MLGQTQIKKEIGERLKDARVAAGFSTAQDFCSKHNLSLPLYQQHENGKRAIKASIAQEYCKLLNVSLNWLLLGKET
jgi:transcriptional regulator with XRE-family HTH domain